jgi:hypothetical protein
MNTFAVRTGAVVLPAGDVVADLVDLVEAVWAEW